LYRPGAERGSENSNPVRRDAPKPRRRGRPRKASVNPSFCSSFLANAAIAASRMRALIERLMPNLCDVNWCRSFSTARIKRSWVILPGHSSLYFSPAALAGLFYCGHSRCEPLANRHRIGSYPSGATGSPWLRRTNLWRRRTSPRTRSDPHCGCGSTHMLSGRPSC
jgi:hypothetical protein